MYILYCYRLFLMVTKILITSYAAKLLWQCKKTLWCISSVSLHKALILRESVNCYFAKISRDLCAV